jgi:uncharacterized NAD-dependent epimerase/dehydratase family protein
LNEQIRAIEVISGKKVIAITLNHEGIEARDIPAACAAINKETGLPCYDVLEYGAEQLVEQLAKLIKQ